jgi:hypothetical protein
MALVTQLNRVATLVSTTVPVDTATSARVCIDGFAIGMVYLPSTFDGTTVTFTVCDTEDGTYLAYEAADGTAVTITTNASSAFALPEGLFGAAYMKFVCGSNQTTTSTVIRLTLKG